MIRMVSTMVLRSLLLVVMLGCTSTKPQPAAAAAPAAPNATELAGVRKMIAGHENEPAETVFKNIQVLKGMPAGRLVNVMDIAFSAAPRFRFTPGHSARPDHTPVPVKATDVR